VIEKGVADKKLGSMRWKNVGDRSAEGVPRAVINGGLTSEFFGNALRNPGI
jgi:hypothetical protein